jgi:hypothetical protein
MLIDGGRYQIAELSAGALSPDSSLLPSKRRRAFLSPSDKDVVLLSSNRRKKKRVVMLSCKLVCLLSQERGVEVGETRIHI